MCEPLMPDVVAPEAHQNDRSYVLRELSGPTFHPLRKNLARWAVTQSTSELSKVGGVEWALVFPGSMS